MSKEDQLRDYLKRVTAELDETQKRLRAAMDRDREPLAIVAMSCRFPGGITSPDDLWQVLTAGREVLSPFPSDRGWDLASLGLTSVAEVGGFLDDVAGFDAGFFGLSPREALGMDPQQRLVLEASWEAIERARLDPVTLAGTATGVYIGTNCQDYEELAAGDTTAEGHLLIGNTPSILSGRIAYILGLSGPALTIDTACSSSLVALHLAGQALRQGDCDLALVGAVTVMTTPRLFVEFTRQEGLAPDGRCKAFSERADGTGFAEGVGVLVVERLSDARRNGHPVLAVVRGTAVNSDGASNGLTAPNGLAQQRVIRAALANSGLSTTDVDVVEAHGTGTTLGDPIEAEALLATYGRDRDAGRPALLGSVKSNLGHTQAVAGLAGLIKVVEAVRHGLVPKTLHVEIPSSQVDWSTGGLELVGDLIPWPEVERPRRAAVSSFGISGTNAHVIVEQAPTPESSAAAVDSVVPWVLSARDDTALAAAARQLLAWGDAPAADVGLALATTRTRFTQRAVVFGAADERRRALTALSSGGSSAGLVSGTARPGELALLFTGQGAQRTGMGSELYATYPVFAAAWDEIAALIDAGWDRCLTELVWDPALAAQLNGTDVAQPALFTFEMALYRLLTSWGVRPSWLAGHSVGEIVAACAAEVFTLPDAVDLVLARGRLMAELPSGGAMIAVEATDDEIRRMLIPGTGIAAVNGPRSVVLSGDEEPTVAVAARIADGGGRTKRLPVSHAFHSHRLDPMLAEFRQVAEGIAYREPKIPIVSNLDSNLSHRPDAEYWVRHVREPVRFADGVRTLAGLGATRFAEIGPDAVLTAMAEETLDASGALCVATQRADRPESYTAIGALARLHVNGTEVDWAGVFPDAALTDVPTYTFTHQRYWPECSTPDMATGSWRYVEDWAPFQPLARPLTGRWAVVVPVGGNERAVVVASALRRAGAGVELLEPVDGAGLAARLSGMDGVVSLLGEDTQPHLEYPALTRGAVATLELIQAVVDGEAGPLWLLTRGAVADEYVSPDQTLLWGLGRVAALEHPACWGGLVDLPAECDDAAGRMLAAVLAAADEDQIAIRETGAVARRLVRAASGDRSDRDWTPAGTTLITGGTGALGAHTARWLAARGARRFLLLSRRGPDAPGADDLVAALAELGATAELVACDVADRAELEALLNRVPDVTAVVHAAGIGQQRPLHESDSADFAAVVTAKIAGACHLDELLADQPLDFFVLFSSVAATWGSGGQYAYAAANALLEGLARRRRAVGRTATSIAWGPWADSGLAKGAELGERMHRLGLPPMIPEQAVAGLGTALDHDDVSVVTAEVDWPVFLAGFTSRRPSPLLAGFAQPPERTQVAEPVALFANQLRGASAATRRRVLRELVGGEAMIVLGHQDHTRIASDRSFRELGFDSLGAIELRNRLAAATGLRLPASLVFDHATVDRLGDHLAAEFGDSPDDLTTVLDELDRVLADSPVDVTDRGPVAARLKKMLARVEMPVATDDLVTATNDEMFDLIDKELGLS